MLNVTYYKTNVRNSKHNSKLLCTLMTVVTDSHEQMYEERQPRQLMAVIKRPISSPQVDSLLRTAAVCRPSRDTHSSKFQRMLTNRAMSLSHRCQTHSRRCVCVCLIWNNVFSIFSSWPPNWKMCPLETLHAHWDTRCFKSCSSLTERQTCVLFIKRSLRPRGSVLLQCGEQWKLLCAFRGWKTAERQDLYLNLLYVDYRL